MSGADRTARQIVRPAEHRATQTRAVATAPALAGLRVPAASEPAEREARQVAERAMRTTAPATSPASRRFEGIVPRTANVQGPVGMAGAVGRPLPLPVRRFMEPRFRADFSRVRIHTDAKAEQLSGQLDAAAFTVGGQVFFGGDRFQPEHAAGRELIAHELAHAIQQGGALQSPPTKGSELGTTVRERTAPQLARAEGVGNAPAGPIVTIAGQNLYRMLDGRIVQLPEDMTAEQAAKLEREALAAQKQLGKGAPPQPVPDVRKPADKGERKAQTKAATKTGKRGGAGKGQAAPRTAAVTVALKAAGGTTAQYLVGKAEPVLARGVARLRTLSRNQQTHDDAAQKLQQTEQAVIVPASEGQSKGNAGQVSVVGGRPAPPVDAAKGERQLRVSLGEHVPRTIEHVDNFKRDRKGQHIGADVLKVMQGDKNAVVSTFADMERTPPPVPPEHPAEALPAEEVAPATATMNLGQGAVAPLLPEHTDVSQYTSQADARLKEEGVTQEQLDMVDNGDLAVANKEKKGLQTAAKTEPAAVQALAAQETQRVDSELKQEEARERGALSGKRKAGLGATRKRQESTKAALERKREEVATHINGIYKTAQDKVKTRLADLEMQSMRRFDEGNTSATTQFEDNVKREIDAFKSDRYSGMFGWARKAKDWLLGLDDLPGVKAIFDRNRAAFVSRIEQLVTDITRDNKRVIQECQSELAKARAEIKTYVDSLGPGLKDIGSKAAREVDGKLDELDGFIRKKEQELQQKLADKQQAAIKAIDEKIEKMKEAMAGALAKLGKLLLWAAKKFFTWALGKFGYSLGDIESIISKGAAVLKAIFTQPIAFVKNLVNAAILGFSNFGKNFLTHLKDALFDWLTGSMQGIALPTTWDLKGIASVALQLVGLTWTNFRGKLVRVMGEPAVKAMEATFDIVVSLVKDGPMAAWEKIQEMASDIKQAFIEGVQDFLKIKVVQKAIETIVSLFVPGAGIVRAVVGIYDTVVFFIQKAKQIIQMIGNFLGAIGEIAAGNIAAAAGALEKGLATGLKLVINFLARFLRLDGITAKIRNAIQKMHSKVDAMQERVVAWIADKAKVVFGKVKSGVKALLQWWKKKLPLGGGGESHTLLFEGDQNNAQLMVRTTPKPPTEFVIDFDPGMTTPEAKKVAQHTIAINKIKQEIVGHQTKNPPDEVLIASLDKKLTEEFNALGAVLVTLLDTSAEEGSEKRPVPVEYPKRRAAAYPYIYVGPATAHYLDQKWLKAAASASGNEKAAKAILLKEEPKLALETTFTNWKGVVKVYRADGGPGQQLPDGETVGLAPAFANLSPGKIIVYVEKAGTGGGGKINKRFRPFGFRPSREAMDGDHVMERQLGGPDSIENLWPLHATENRSSGAKVNSMEVSFGKLNMTVHQAREKHQKPKKRKGLALNLLITKVRD